jgi:septum formation protein
VDETPLPDESPPGYVARLALAKARAGVSGMDRRKACPVLGADTAVVVDDAILGKPGDRDEGIGDAGPFVRARASRVQRGGAGDRDRGMRSWFKRAEVRFRELSRAECAAYWDSGEPLDKAGGYGIQGRAAAFVAELRGSYSGVMGLPLFETAELLREFGISLWRSATS